MSGEKWTKGPWGWTDHGAGELVVYDLETDMAICTLDDNDKLYSWKEGYSTGEEAPANAHLIAAAPFNYSAHEHLLDGLRKVLSGIPVRDMDERILASEKALAKARGEDHG